MSNLLPPENQKNILRAQRTRSLFVFSIVALVCALVFYTALLPSLIALLLGGVKIKNQTATTASTTPQTTLMREIKTAVVQLNSVTGATSTPSEVLAIVLAAKPAGVMVDALSYTSGKPGKIVLHGNAQRSDLVQAYRNALASDPHFDSVTIPVSALVGTNNGAFTMTLSGSF